jgi:fumarate hydratase class II
MVKIGRSHTQDATPLTLGQEWSGYAGMLTDDLEWIVVALDGVSAWHWVALQLVRVSTRHRA